MARLDEPIILIDESVVRYGFRSLMSGAELDEFKANPVMLYLHNRNALTGDTDSMLPIGKWVDIQIKGDKLIAYPEFDDDDEFAQKIERKVKKGYLNAASIWIDPIEVSDDDSLKLKGQPGPTVTRWGVLEASIVDIPNCRGALAIRNAAGEKVLLTGGDSPGGVLDYLKSFLPNNNFQKMDQKVLALKLGLSETASLEQIQEKLQQLGATALAAANMKTENDTLKGELVRLKQENVTQKVTALVDGAIKDGKLVAGERDMYVKLATSDFETVESLLAVRKQHETIETKLQGKTNTPALVDELQSLLALPGEKLYMDEKLERLQELSLEHFKLKYKEAFGVEYVA